MKPIAKRTLLALVMGLTSASSLAVDWRDFDESKNKLPVPVDRIVFSDHSIIDEDRSMTIGSYTFRINHYSTVQATAPDVVLISNLDCVLSFSDDRASCDLILTRASGAEPSSCELKMSRSNTAIKAPCPTDVRVVHDPDLLQIDWRSLSATDVPVAVQRITFSDATLDTLEGGLIKFGDYLVSTGDMRHVIMNRLGGSEPVGTTFYISGLYCENAERDTIEYCVLALLRSVGEEKREECSLHLRIVTAEASATRYFPVPCPTTVMLMDRFELIAQQNEEQLLLEKYGAHNASCADLYRECSEDADLFCASGTLFPSRTCTDQRRAQIVATKRRVCQRLAAYCRAPTDRGALFR